jgi:hypothetical protein
MRRLLVLAMCVGVLALAGCGGGSDDSDSASTPSSTQEAALTTTPQASQQNTTAQAPEKGQQANKDSSSQGEDSRQQGNSSSSSHPKHLHLVRVPQISSAPKAGSKAPAPGVKTVAGGDNSVQEYGVEADTSERREASIALQAYLNAREREDWSTACSLLAKKPTEQLEKLSGGKAGCVEVLAATGKGAPSMPGSVIGEVLSLRGGGDISGDPSYLIFTGPPGNTLFSMPMYLEGRTWKVGLAQPSELPV